MPINKNLLTKIPNEPGVYIFKDFKKEILYIGKAKILRNRVRSYFNKSSLEKTKNKLMVPKIDTIDWIVVRNEVEAILTEANLIKKNRPRYNILLKDDKTFPYIQITNEPYPRVMIVRKNNLSKDKHLYFGPYSDVSYLRKTMKVIHKIFQLRTCSFYIDDRSIEKKEIKICLDYHIKKCNGPCEGLESQISYNRMIDKIKEFLKGKNKEVKDYIESMMIQSSKKLRFELAAKYRDQLIAIDSFSKKQKKVANDFKNRDVLALAIDGSGGIGVVLRIRNGLLIGKENFKLSGVKDENLNTIFLEYFIQYYHSTKDIPEEILTMLSVENVKEYECWLSNIIKKKIKIIVPKIGEKKSLIDLAIKNAKLILGKENLKKIKIREKIPKQVQILKNDLNMKIPPRRIEAFDISNIQGSNSVASMVCFIDGKPRKKEYRKYKIKTVRGIDDFKSMEEVVFRRYNRVMNEKSQLPDLILIDGGKGQLNSATRSLNKLGLNYITIIGLAKRLEDVFFPGFKNPQNISKKSPGLFLLKYIRDEAHRFALSFHRKLRSKSMIKSILDDIPGIGPKRRDIIWKNFSSIDELRNSTIKDIQKRLKFSEKVIQKIVDRFKDSD